LEELMKLPESLDLRTATGKDLDRIAEVSGVYRHGRTDQELRNDTIAVKAEAKPINESLTHKFVNSLALPESESGWTEVTWSCPRGCGAVDLLKAVTAVKLPKGVECPKCWYPKLRPMHVECRHANLYMMVGKHRGKIGCQEPQCRARFKLSEGNDPIRHPWTRIQRGPDVIHTCDVASGSEEFWKTARRADGSKFLASFGFMDDGAEGRWLGWLEPDNDEALWSKPDGGWKFDFRASGNPAYDPKKFKVDVIGEIQVDAAADDAVLGDGEAYFTAKTPKSEDIGKEDFVMEAVTTKNGVFARSHVGPAVTRDSIVSLLMEKVTWYDVPILQKVEVAASHGLGAVLVNATLYPRRMSLSRGVADANLGAVENRMLELLQEHGPCGVKYVCRAKYPEPETLIDGGREHDG
jgi:hypothetical protein